MEPRRVVQLLSKIINAVIAVHAGIQKLKILHMRPTRYSFLYKAADGSIMRPESFLNINKGRTLSSSQLRVLGITKIKNESFKRK